MLWSCRHSVTRRVGPSETWAIRHHHDTDVTHQVSRASPGNHRPVIVLTVAALFPPTLLLYQLYIIWVSNSFKRNPKSNLAFTLWEFPQFHLKSYKEHYPCPGCCTRELVSTGAVNLLVILIGQIAPNSDCKLTRLLCEYFNTIGKLHLLKHVHLQCTVAVYTVYVIAIQNSSLLIWSTNLGDSRSWACISLCIALIFTTLSSSPEPCNYCNVRAFNSLCNALIVGATTANCNRN